MALGGGLRSLSHRFTDAAVTQFRADGFDVCDQDVARLSPFARHHVVLGRSWFPLPEMPGDFGRCVTRTGGEV